MWGPLPLGHSPRFLLSAPWSYLLDQIWKLWCTLIFPSASHLLSPSLLPLRTPWLCILGTAILCRCPNLRGPKQLGRAEPCARWLALTDLRWCARCLRVRGQAHSFLAPFPSPFLPHTLSWKDPALVFQCLCGPHPVQWMLMAFLLTLSLPGLPSSPFSFLSSHDLF